MPSVDKDLVRLIRLPLVFVEVTIVIQVVKGVDERSGLSQGPKVLSFDVELLEPRFELVR